MSRWCSRTWVLSRWHAVIAIVGSFDPEAGGVPFEIPRSRNAAPFIGLARVLGFGVQEMVI